MDENIIVYIAGGYLGDFFMQLNVIQEKYIHTGKKGLLYITDIKQDFRNPVQKVYHDTYPIVIMQDYIFDYKIYSNEVYQVDLSSWRNHPNLYQSNFAITLSLEYDISYGSHKWLNNIPIHEKWNNVILINTVDYRPCRDKIEIQKLKEQYPECTIVFISIFKEHYTDFINLTQETNISHYCPETLLETAIAIQSCKLFVGITSGLLWIAYSFHHPSITLVPKIESEVIILSNLDHLNTQYHY